MTTFADFDVHPDIRDALTEAGITTPFPIQESTLPLALSGADVIGQARTGTGKTFAFGVPLLQGLGTSDGVPQGLVIVPTRELCVQVRDDLAKLGARLDASVLAVYGGRPIQPQADALEAGADVVVGTPGRLLDLVGRKVLDLSRVSTLVLDEADEMLDLGFLPDVEQLIAAVPEQRQTMLFSATMPGAVVSLARRYMQKPTFLQADEEEGDTSPETEQHFLACHRMDKPAVLARILQSPHAGRTLAFTRTKRMADVLAGELSDRGIRATPIHADLRQESREDAMTRFRNGDVDVLVATEVAARGLDISQVTHVVNYDCPEDEKMYLHRIGRTGRAGAAGVAITLGTWNELARLDAIKNALGVDTPTHEAYSTSPILDELFQLPPRDQQPARGKKPAASSKGPSPSGKGSGSRQRTRSKGRASSPRASSKGDKSSEQPATAEEAESPEQPATAEEAESPEQPAAAEAESPEQPAAAEPEPDSAQAGGSETGAGGGDERPVRRRVRTRSRDGGRATGPGEGSRQRRVRPDDAQDSPSAGTDGQEREQQPARAEQAAPRQAEEGQPPAKTPTRGKSKGAKSSGGAKSRSRSGGKKSAAGGRPGRSGRSQTPSGASRNGQPPDVTAARGGGKPALRRPMVVTHLP